MLAVSAISMLSLSSCKGDRAYNDPTLPQIKAIQLQVPVEVKPGDAIPYSLKVMPEDYEGKVDLRLESSSEKVIKVDDRGNLVAVGVGEATIKAVVKGNEKILDECKVVVKEDAQKIIFIGDKGVYNAILLDYDENQDEQLQYSEALKVVELDVSDRSVRSIAGLEQLPNLEVLICRVNPLHKADLTKFPKLRVADFKGCMLDTVNVRDLETLEELSCRGNRLQEIDVTTNKNLKKLDLGMNLGQGCDHDGIRKVDVTQNPELEYLDLYYLNISEVDVTHNPKLEYLDFSLSGNDNPDKFGVIESIDLSKNPRLKVLHCEASNKNGKGLTQLDLTHAPELEELYCPFNLLTSLDLSKNTKLRQLNLLRNPIEKLDVTHCPDIEMIYCAYSKIKELDLSNSHKLSFLRCHNCDLQKLDISATVMSYLDAKDNHIKEFIVGDKVFDTPSGNENKPYLYINVSHNEICSINVAKQSHLAWLDVTGNRLSSLDISGCSYLGGLKCAGNRISNIDLGKHNRMWELDVAGNRLSGELDLSHLVDLHRGAFHSNKELKSIKLAPNIDPDETYFMGGVGTLPCFTKDAHTLWKK